MFFCPTCANFLLMDQRIAGGVQFYCKTCDYVSRVRKHMEKEVKFDKKNTDLIIGGAAEWENASQTTENCRKCSNTKAYFWSQQLRSADEPETVTYRCTQCTHTWIVN